jgi:hypothetical protein
MSKASTRWLAVPVLAIVAASTLHAFPVPEAGPVSVPQLSVEARTLPEPAIDEGLFTREINRRGNPLAGEPDQGRRGTWGREEVPTDALVWGAASALSTTPTPLLSIDGLSVTGVQPPDIVGATGPGHYVQMVNATHVRVIDKLGTTLGTFLLGDLWPVGQACRSNHGDPIVVYDGLADRWLLTQFRSGSPHRMCMAVSVGADPLGAYHIYTFDMVNFPDYFKLGVWPDAYYMSANESSYTAYAFERTAMLAGLPATFQRFTGQNNLLLPADLDGPNSPPPGTPGVFYTFKSSSFHGGIDRLELFALDVDFATPANTTFTLIHTLPLTSLTYTVCGFFNFNCVRQLGTTQRLDTISEWPMFRFPYRNFGSRQSLVGAFTVGGGLGEQGGAIRWFELRNEGAGWALYQEGTWDPGDGHDRWNPSIAMDASGNIALGYSVSSSTIHPRIAYATRLASDPLGTLAPEVVLHAGTGPHTSTNRWGDYSAMTVDPVDDCTFWYTNQYFAAASGTQFRTRIGAFVLPSCGACIQSLVLENQVLNASQVFEACEEILVGPNLQIVFPANIELRAGKRVVLFDDTMVGTGAALKISIDPDLLPD